MLAGTNKDQGWLGNIAIDDGGAVIGGLLSSLIVEDGLDVG